MVATMRSVHYLARELKADRFLPGVSAGWLRRRLHTFNADNRSSNRMKRGRESNAVSLRNQTRGTTLCVRATVARGIRGRGHGLLGRRELAHEEGMLFDAGLLPL